MLAALDLDEGWYKTCAETLRLLERYGPGGRRAEDARVVAMVNDDRQNMRRLQRMLREIDADWELRNAEDG